MKRMLLPLSLGLTHGVADCISGYMIGMMAGRVAEGMILTLIVIYNVLAFGGQTPFGVLLDAIGGVKRAALISVALIATGMLVFTWSPLAAIILAGLGSAGFHVAGGAATLRADAGNAAGPGLFAAPGVMGLILGGWLATQGIPVQWYLFGGIVALGFLLGNLRFPQLKSPQASETHHGFEMHDLIMIVLLLAIAFRSAIWNIMNLVHDGNHELLLYIGVAAMLGKVLGGYAADRIGWRNYILGAMGLAIPALTFGGNEPLLLLPGIALLQSATPVAIAAMHRAMPRYPATAAGISLGLAISIGGIPLFTGASPTLLSNILVIGGAGAISFLLYLFSVGKAQKMRL